MNPETVSLNRERQALVHAQHLLDTGHPVKATKALERLALRSPSYRDGQHAELCPTKVKIPATTARRGQVTAQQKFERWLHHLTVSQRSGDRYFKRHADDIRRILHASRPELRPNTPVEKNDTPDPWERYEAQLMVWRGVCQRRYEIVDRLVKMCQRGATLERMLAYAAKHPDIFPEGRLTARPAPPQPVEPEECRTTSPRRDGRTGFRKEASKKTNTLTAIDKRMAAERQKISKDDKPRPVMRHHVDANPWLYAKHARNK
tara:strand:+ start:329 stop:1111 length:783 start_codon:yes stop_codon:yes gene_type:complete